MNKKMDLTGVEKKVDTNVEEARALAKQRKLADEEKAKKDAEKAEK
jgi:hypothetical protein